MFYEEKTILMTLTDDEKIELKDRNAEIDLELIRKTEDIEEKKTKFKADTNPLKKEKGRNLQTLRSGYIEKTLKVAEYVNETTGMLEFIDENGEKVYERALTPKERHQFKIPFNQPTSQNA